MKERIKSTLFNPFFMVFQTKLRNSLSLPFKLTDRRRPVSYTHLDVYKRQGKTDRAGNGRPAGAGPGRSRTYDGPDCADRRI